MTFANLFHLADRAFLHISFLEAVGVFGVDHRQELIKTGYFAFLLNL